MMHLGMSTDSVATELVLEMKVNSNGSRLLLKKLSFCQG